MLASEVAQVKHDADLLSVVGRDVALKRVATTRGGEWAGPCPFCGGADRFRVQPERGLWWCRQCSPDEHWQDIFAYVMRRDGVDFPEAAARLNGGTLSPTFKAARPIGKPDRAQPADWHGVALEAVTACEAALWADTPGARGALDWLHKRGLTDDTLKAWRVGFNPKSQTIAGLWCESGVTLPYFAGDKLHAVNVRRPDSFLRVHPQADKYKMIAGSKRVLFGVAHVAGLPDVMITEGEFDALLIWQEARDLCDVLTMGGAKSMPAGTWLAYLVNGQRFIVATDNDGPGDEAAARWVELLGSKAQRVIVPDGKDVTAYWQAGGNVRDWVKQVCPTVDEWQNLLPDNDPARAMPDEVMPQADLVAVFDAWEQAADPADPKWRRLWAEACQAAGIGLCEDGVTLQPPAAWRAWARQPA